MEYDIIIKVERMQERLNWLLGENLELITNKTILIVGLGGVGGYTLEALARTGIQKLIIVDNDIVDISNINRQIIALTNTIGKYKTDVFEKRIHFINPHCEVIKITEFITKENLSMLFSTPIDYVVDACDTLETKKEIIKYCLQHNIKFVSSMGMAKRIDCTKIKVSDLSKTCYDPLAKKLRFLLRKENIKGKIPVIYSEEIPLKIEKLGSIITVVATAGFMCANYIINDIIKGVNHE